ncbi:hypothetical protein B484DRAFT_429454 [Ochromonadaceae sp. CCMP2298]|nr:hypothetical protein B484DRAFT_429454 [Ochromonadaceae sp. CCMP2298]|mmetsp:Transcript_31706/g.69850  ORF Transcript_31706/g.69850 Transcript_31706/m.69850 type:complete len:265 (-) Transcript_31706:62-856(-)
MSDITGFKLKFAQRDHQPACAPRETLLLPGGLVRQSVPAQTSCIIGERGKKNFELRYSESQEPKFKKPVPHQESCGEAAARGRKVIAPPTTDHLDRGPVGKVHFSEPRSEFIKRSPNFAKRAEVPQGLEQVEYNMEVSMNRKQRVSDSTRRNGIGLATGGDKAFREADREPGFYAKGGLVVGSTMASKKSAKPTLQKREDSNTGPPKKLEATYGKLMLRLAQEYDQSQVASLTKPSATHQGEYVPSWEERTGLHLVDPDDESVY